MPATILYATAKVEGRAVGERVPRPAQSAAAADLLHQLRGQLDVAAHSRSHSRTLVAVAAGDAGGLLLGIDIEWRKPGRPFAALASVFADIGTKTLGMEEFYRLWTFGEAYFKAFQRLPTPAQLYEGRGSTDGHTEQLSDGTFLFQCLVDGHTQLSLVWRSASGQPCDLRRV